MGNNNSTGNPLDKRMSLNNRKDRSTLLALASTGQAKDYLKKNYDNANEPSNMYRDYIKGAGGDADFARNNSRNLRQSILDQYGNGNGGLNSMMNVNPNSSGWFDLPQDEYNFSGVGHASGGDFSKAKDTYGMFADTGNAGDFEEALGGYRDFAGSGGVDATALRRRSTAQIPTFYNQYKQAAQRRSNVQGGYSPGFDAQQAELGRQAGREGFEASRQVEGDIAEMTQRGRMFGISGMGDIAGRISGNRLSGAGGLTDIGGYEQSNNQFNAGIDQFNAGMGENINARRQGQQMDLAKMFQSGNQYSAAGRRGVYDADREDLAGASGRQLAGIGGLSQDQLQRLYYQLAKKNSNKIDWSKWAGMGAGALAAI